MSTLTPVPALPVPLQARVSDETMRLARAIIRDGQGPDFWRYQPPEDHAVWKPACALVGSGWLP